MWGTKTENRHRWQCGAVVRGGDARGRGHRFESRWPRSREFYTKKCRRWTGAGRWGPPSIKKNSHFFGFFSVPTLSSVGHSTKALPSVDFWHSAKKFLPIRSLPRDLCQVRHSAKPLPSAWLALPSAPSTRQRWRLQ